MVLHRRDDHGHGGETVEIGFKAGNQFSAQFIRAAPLAPPIRGVVPSEPVRHTRFLE